MTVERRNPLPEGIYWVDVFSPKVGPSAKEIPDFMTWLGQNPDSVDVLNADTRPPGMSTGSMGDGFARLWVLFQVKKPVTWPSGFGFPTIAERPDLTSDETAHNLPTTVSEMIEEVIPEVAELGVNAVKWGALILGGYVAFKLLNRKD